MRKLIFLCLLACLPFARLCSAGAVCKGGAVDRKPAPELPLNTLAYFIQ